MNFPWPDKMYVYQASLISLKRKFPIFTIKRNNETHLQAYINTYANIQKLASGKLIIIEVVN